MKNKIISSRKEVSDLFHNTLGKYSIFGMGVSHWLRFYFDNIFIPNYHIIALTDFKDSSYISKFINTLTSRDESEKITTNRSWENYLSNKNTLSYLRKKDNVVILPYKPREATFEIARKNNWIIAANSVTINTNLENKKKFRLKYNQVFNFPKFIHTNTSDISYARLQEKLDNNFVIQIPESSGGAGTFIINNKSDYNKYIPLIDKKVAEKDSNDLIVSKFARGMSYAVSAVISRWGVLVEPPSYQITSIDENGSSSKGSGVYSGHDYSKSKEIPRGMLEKIIIDIKKFGEMIQLDGYKGYLGLDLIIDVESNEYYVIECNPRITGSEPLNSMMSEKYNYIPLIALHLMEFLADDKDKVDVDIEKVQKSIPIYKDGSNIILYSKSNKTTLYKFKYKPGVYIFENNNFIFKREGSRFTDLKNPDEFLLVEMVSEDDLIKPGGRICRILFNKAIIDVDQKLKLFAKNIIDTFYKDLEYKVVD